MPTCRSLAVLCTLLLSTAWAQSPTLQASATKTYTIDSARREAFLDVPTKINRKAYAALDPDFIENFQARANKEVCLPDRQIDVFDDGSYSVTFYGSDTGRRYSPNGQLILVDVGSKPLLRQTDKPPDYYPIRDNEYVYATGKLRSIAFHVRRFENYTFLPNGSFVGYCKDNTCYDPNMKPYGTRELVEPCP